MLTKFMYSALLLTVLLKQGLVEVAAKSKLALKKVQHVEEIRREKSTGYEDNTINDYFSDEELSKRDILPDGYVINTTVSTDPGVPLSPVYCQPFPTVVKVPLDQDAAYMYMPSHVILSRCAGIAGDPRAVHCVAKKQDDIAVSVYKMSYTSKRGFDIAKRTNGRMVDVRMMNHTECGYSCIVGSHMCEPGRTAWVQNHCRCECMVDIVNATCDHTLHDMDEMDCKCACRSQPTPCTDDKREWSDKTCSCACLQKIVNRCERKNKLLDENSCECYCAPVTCPPGTVLNNYDCSCV